MSKELLQQIDQAVEERKKIESQVDRLSELENLNYVVQDFQRNARNIVSIAEKLGIPVDLMEIINSGIEEPVPEYDSDPDDWENSDWSSSD